MTRLRTTAPYIFFTLLALIPLSAVVTPRDLTFLPGLAGLMMLATSKAAFAEKIVWPKAAFFATLSVCVLGIASALWSHEPMDSLSRAVRAALVLLSCVPLIAAALTLKPETLKKTAWILPLSLGIAALLIAIELKCGQPLFRMVRGLGAAHIVTPAEYNRAAVVIALLFFPSFAILRRYLDRWQSIAVTIICLAPMLVVTESQSSQMALLLGGLCWLLFPYGRHWAWPLLASVFALMMLAAPFAAIWVFHHFAADINDVPLFGPGGAYAGARLEIWDYVSRYMLHRPLIGYGFEATRQVSHFDSHQIYQAGTTILHPHNFVIQIWMEFGIVGIGLAITLMTTLLIAMRDRLTVAQARIALPTLIACMSVASTGYGLWQGWWLGLLYTAAAATLISTRLAAAQTVQ